MPKIWFCLMIISALLFGSVCAKAADERFAVEVNVDVTDTNASVAREKAMSEANRAAFVEVAKRITTPEGAARLAGMNDAQLLNFIKEVSVVEEKSSNVRYIATLKVVLNEAMLRQYMQEREIPAMIQTSSNILAVPVFRAYSSDAPMLWEDNNMWRQAWENAPQGSGVTFIPLLANGTNYSIIDAGKALALDGPALDKLMRVNGADEVYVLDTTYDGIDGLIIKATSYEGNTQTIRVAGSRSSGMQLFNDAVLQVQAQLAQKARQQSVREDAAESSVVILYNFDSLGEWVEAESTIRSIPYVKSLEMQAMGTNKAQFKLSFVGTNDKLLYALRAKSFNLIDHGRFFSLEKI